jgi:hypothetical protein
VSLAGSKALTLKLEKFMEHPRFVVLAEGNYWVVFDELARMAIFGCDRKWRCEEYALARNRAVGAAL